MIMAPSRRERKRKLPVAGVVVALGILGSACGVAENGADRLPAETLLGRLRPDARSVTVADLDEVRDRLGVDPEAVETGSLPEGDDARAFFAVAATVLPYLARPDPDIPLRAAIDLGRVVEVASDGSGIGTLTALATRQPVDEIAASLESAGYRRDGDLLRSDARAVDVVNPTVGLGDGVLVLGSRTEQVREALAGREGDPDELVEALRAVPGPARVATLGGGECVRSLAVGWEVVPPRGVGGRRSGGGPNGGVAGRRHDRSANPGVRAGAAGD